MGLLHNRYQANRKVYRKSITSTPGYFLGIEGEVAIVNFCSWCVNFDMVYLYRFPPLSNKVKL